MLDTAVVREQVQHSGMCEVIVSKRQMSLHFDFIVVVETTYLFIFMTPIVQASQPARESQIVGP